MTTIHPIGTPEGRKQRPIVTGVLDYFPDALLEVALCSYVGNEQHNPGEPLHWDRSKSTDEVDALGRHLVARGTIDTDGVRHSAKVAWRALAMLQKEIEAERKTEQGKVTSDRCTAISDNGYFCTRTDHHDLHQAISPNGRIYDSWVE